jgi:hypothetical protein
VVSVVDVPETLFFVANTEVPAASYSFTEYEDAFDTAFHETSSDLGVALVAVAATDVGEDNGTGGSKTETAVDELLVVPFPNAPYVFRPQHFTVVSAKTAHVWLYPVEILETFDSPLTKVGTDLSVDVPSPRFPWPFQPQHIAVPLAKTAHGV